MSSGSAAHTASMPSSRRHAPGRGGTLRRIQVAAVCASSRGGAGRLPGRLEWARVRGQPVELALGALHVQQDQRVDPRDRAAVAPQPAAVLEHVLALHVGGERLHAELARQRGEAVLGRPDPLGADLHDVAAADVLVEHPAADPVARLHDDHGRSRGRQPRARPSARRARRRPPPHRPRALCRLRHRRAPYPVPDAAEPAGSLCCGRWLRLRARARRSAG